MDQIHRSGVFGCDGKGVQLQSILIEPQAHLQPLHVNAALLLHIPRVDAAEGLVLLHVVDHVRRGAPEAQRPHLVRPQARHDGGHTAPQAQPMDGQPVQVHKVQPPDVVQDIQAVGYLSGDSHVLEPPVALAAAGEVEADAGNAGPAQPAGELGMYKIDLVAVVTEAVEQDNEGELPLLPVRNVHHPPQGQPLASALHIFFQISSSFQFLMPLWGPLPSFF